MMNQGYAVAEVLENVNNATTDYAYEEAILKALS